MLAPLWTKNITKTSLKYDKKHIDDLNINKGLMRHKVF